LVVFLQATCPVRSGADIDAAVALLESSGADSVLSVSPAHAFLWEEREGRAVALNYDWRHRPRRQDMPPQYRENGSIYVFKPWVLRQGANRLGGRIALYRMSEEAGVDIDSELDLVLAGLLLRASTEGRK
jgi:N-acylneuraminate cytidylyltransferase